MTDATAAAVSAPPFPDNSLGDLHDAKLRVVNLGAHARDMAQLLERLAYSRELPATVKQAVYHAAFDMAQAKRMLDDAREELEKAARACRLERRGA